MNCKECATWSCFQCLLLLSFIIRFLLSQSEFLADKVTSVKPFTLLIDSMKSSAFWREFSKDGQSQVLSTSRNVPVARWFIRYRLDTKLFFLILLKSAVRLTKALKLDMFNFDSAHPRRNFKILYISE